MSSVISLIEVKVKQICVAWLWHPIRGNKTNTTNSVGTTSMAAAYINQLYLGYNYEKS